MDKLFSKGWFIKLTSIVIAIMLFLMVNMDTQPQQAGAGLPIPGVTNGERVLEEVPLNVYYDDEQYVLTDAPDTVQVVLRGPNSALTLGQATQGQQEIYIDLENEEAGTHYERIQHRGFPPDLRVSIVPLTVQVTLQERQTASYPVDIQILNEEELAEGYTIGEPEASPGTIDVTAASGMLEQISQVRAAVDVSGRSESFTDTASVVLYDESGNEMGINADPPAVDVTVPITSPNKSVPLRMSRNGELADGMAIDSVSIEPEEVTVYGPVDVLNEISVIDLDDLDLDEIEGDTTLTVPVPVPDGVERVEPGEVTVDIDMTAEEEREFSSFSIDVESLPNTWTFNFPGNEDGTFTLRALGSSEQLDRLSREDIEASVDVDGLEAGTHTVSLAIGGPQNVRFPQHGSDVEITIEDDNSSDAVNENEPNASEESQENETNEAAEENEEVNEPENDQEENTNDNNEPDEPADDNSTINEDEE
ncbi:CdaR family protein [Alkalicoccus luteus]|uniref:YbbR-like domain-containing protein n=1 Tax=Alkalicoccus luteus TaxID=1237094 RepID=A0A969PPQ5_9BACI|nr:CdaR family protein [Alkalicoccus luteus]NJP36151.1 YbbR-like domain-containing protein [Alkalicoccus luteus]